MRYHRPAWRYDPRRTCAAVPLSKGANPKSVRELPGHADIKLALGNYSHNLHNNMGDQTATAMESALGQNGLQDVCSQGVPTPH